MLTCSPPSCHPATAKRGQVQDTRPRAHLQSTGTGHTARKLASHSRQLPHGLQEQLGSPRNLQESTASPAQLQEAGPEAQPDTADEERWLASREDRESAGTPVKTRDQVYQPLQDTSRKAEAHNTSHPQLAANDQLAPRLQTARCPQGIRRDPVRVSTEHTGAHSAAGPQTPQSKTLLSYEKGMQEKKAEVLEI